MTYRLPKGIAETPHEVRVGGWCHAEFYFESGYLRLRRLVPSPTGYNLVPGGTLVTMSFKALQKHGNFLDALALMIDRWRLK